MTDLLERSVPRLSNKRLHGRVVNAVATFLRHKLAVPNVYISPRIANVQAADVIAADSAGSGDLHAVEVKTGLAIRTRSELRSLLQEVMSLPFHFKYLALSEELNPIADLARFAEYPELFDESGIGRIGILAVNTGLLDSVIDLSGGTSHAIGMSPVRLVIRPERFRVIGKSLPAIEKFLAKAKPDMEVRI